MGCAASRESRTNLTVALNVIIGNKVLKRENNDVQIIFIFGGPGSKKGRIVDELSENYGFRVIDAEDIILNNLSPNDKIEEYSDKVKRIERLLKENPKYLTLQWILARISYILQSTNDQKLWLIDLLPKLPFVLQNKTFSKKCSSELATFEEQWPCMFALNLASLKIENVEKIKEKSVATSAPVRFDEKDLAKTKKRLESYSENSKEVINYFRNADRLVTVDISCGLAEKISARISTLFAELGFQTLEILSNNLTVFQPKSGNKLGLKELPNSANKQSQLSLQENVMKNWSSPITDVNYVEIEDLHETRLEVPKKVVIMLPIDADIRCALDKIKITFPFKAFTLAEKQLCFFPKALAIEDCVHIWRRLQ